MHPYTYFFIILLLFTVFQLEQAENNDAAPSVQQLRQENTQISIAYLAKIEQLGSVTTLHSTGFAFGREPDGEQGSSAACSHG